MYNCVTIMSLLCYSCVAGDIVSKELMGMEGDEEGEEGEEGGWDVDNDLVLPADLVSSSSISSTSHPLY